MVWACFWGKRRGPLVSIREAQVDGHVYIAVLESVLGPVMEEMADDPEVEDPLFQKDNTRVHTAKDLAWLHENGIDLEDHPPLSPDPNPIEHAWVELKRRLHKQYPDILDTKKGPETVGDRLAEVLPHV